MLRSLQYILVLTIAIALLAAGVADPSRVAHGYLGVEFAPLTRSAQARAPFMTHGGALILRVDPESPADRAGFRAGQIVVAVNGRHIATAAEAADAIDYRDAGAKVALSFYDLDKGDRLPRKLAALLAAGPPPDKSVYTVRPPRTLAPEWSYTRPMAANASWSPRIARGAVNPLPLKRFDAGQCSAVAPDGWKITGTSRDGRAFSLSSAGGHVRASYEYAVVKGADVARFIEDRIALIVKARPQASLKPGAKFGFRAMQFGTPNGYAGFALYSGHDNRTLSLWIAAVPATEVAGLAPLAGAVALSIHCRVHDFLMSQRFDEAFPATAVSTRCLEEGHCNEADFAGAYNDELHEGYVHSADGEDFLIDPRKDIWETGPAGPGTYRQMGGSVEKLEPGRTN